MKKSEEQKAEEQRTRLLAIRDAIVAHWLRYARGPNVDEIAKRLGASVSQVRATLKASARREYDGIDESNVPGCTTHPHGSWGGRGNGSYPTTWEPTTQYLRAMLRGEGQYESEWTVRVHAVPAGRAALWTPNFAFEIVALSEEEAIAEARKRAEVEVKGALHPNSSFKVEWRGKFFVSDKPSIDAAIARMEARR